MLSLPKSAACAFALAFSFGESAVSTPAVPANEQSAFDPANQYANEKSFARACEAFSKFLEQYPRSALAPEAKVKRTRACLQSGHSEGRDMEELHAAAGEGAADLPRALANLTLCERGENYLQGTNRERLPLALDQLSRVARKSGGRWGSEAHALLFASSLEAMENRNYDAAFVERSAARLLDTDPTEAERDHVLFERGKSWIRTDATRDRAEKDLVAVGERSSEWADDAIDALAESLEGRGQYERALGLYDSIVKRFSPTTSNVRSSAESRAADIRRESIGLTVAYVEIPGSRPQASLSFRNVAAAHLTLRRHDPLTQDARQMLAGGEAASAGVPREVVRSWDVSLQAPSRYAPGSKSFDVEVTQPGVYMLEAVSGSNQSSALVQITPWASVLKVSRNHVWVWTVDAMTGQPASGAEVVVYGRLESRGSSDLYERFTAKSDALGLARLTFGRGTLIEAAAWSGKDGGFAYASGESSSPSDGQKEVLAYVLTDRPLYKPGESVGVKIFIRTRQKGPTLPVADAELEVRTHDVQGREIDKRTLRTSRFGTADFGLKLKKDAQLGAYSFSLSGRRLSINDSQGGFRVEEYKPPEYTVSAEPVGRPMPGDPVKMKVSASFFFGGPVANAEGRAIVTESGWQHEWKPWPDEPADGESGGSSEYGYRRKGRYDYGYWGQLGQQTLTFRTGADGTAELSIVPGKGEGLPTDRSYHVEVFVTDASRREVTGSGTVNVSATPVFVDLRTDRILYKPGEQMAVKLRAEDANGHPASANVAVRLVKLLENGSTQSVLERRASIKEGSGSVKLDADAVGPVRIEAWSLDPKIPAALASTDAWLTNPDKPIVPPGAGFALITDRGPLAAGKTVRGLVVAPSPGGTALVSIEGEELNDIAVVEIKGRARFVELPLTSAMTPNVWLHVSRIENLNYLNTQTELHVLGGDTTLDVKVRYPKASTEPGSQLAASVEVSGKAGGAIPSEVAVAVVDEAIFSIEPERTDFLSFFGRQRQEERVTTRASIEHRAFNPASRRPEKAAENPVPPPDATPSRAMEEASGAGAPAPASPAADMAASKPAVSNEKRMQAPGKRKEEGLSKDDAAGEGGAAAPVKVRSNFASSAGWFPSLAGTSPGETRANASFPDSLTSWRTIATVVTTGPQLGVGRGTIRTEKPLMVRLQGPRFFTERDEVTLSAVVTSRLPQAAPVTVEFLAPGLKPLGGLSQKIVVPAGGDLRVDKRFAVLETGDRKVRVTARAANAADAMEWTLPAVVHGSAQRQFFTGQLRDRIELKVALPERRNPSGTRFELVASPSLLGVMLDALPYLAHYPYGCVEQTLSKFVPAAIAAKAVRKLGLPATRVPADLDDMVGAGLKRLYGFQHPDGGWGWWQSDPTNRWMSAYAVYGLSLGREAGLDVDRTVLERGRAYLRDNLGAAIDRPDEHAFMTFALAATGGAPPVAIDKDFENRTQLSRRGRALLALALEAARDSRARIAVENLDDIVNAAKGRADASVGEANDAWQTSEAIEATAYTLMAVYRHDAASPLVRPLTDFLVLRRNGGKWRNTRDTAFAVYALADIAMREAAMQSAGSLTVLVNGKTAATLKYSRGGVDITGPVVLADSAFRPGNNVIEIHRDGRGTGYFAATWDVYNQDENLKAVGGDVVVSRTYTLLGKPSSQPAALVAEYGMPVDSGTRVRVDVEVKANKAVEYLMVEDLKAAGLEAVMQRSGPEVCAYACAHAELRPDRVAMFLTEIPVGVTKLSYELRAEVPGRFHALPARVEAMYAPEIRATSDEMRFEVRDAREPSSGVAKQ